MFPIDKGRQGDSLHQRRRSPTPALSQKSRRRHIGWTSLGLGRCQGPFGTLALSPTLGFIRNPSEPSETTNNIHREIQRTEEERRPDGRASR